MEAEGKNQDLLLRSATERKDFIPRLQLTERLKVRLETMMEEDKKDLEELDDRHMAKAERAIEKLRPLRDAPVEEIIPILKCCKCSEQ